MSIPVSLIGARVRTARDAEACFQRIQIYVALLEKAGGGGAPGAPGPQAAALPAGIKATQSGFAQGACSPSAAVPLVGEVIAANVFGPKDAETIGFWTKEIMDTPGKAEVLAKMPGRDIFTRFVPASRKENGP